jgi:hypothetical protein
VFDVRFVGVVCDRFGMCDVDREVIRDWGVDGVHLPFTVVHDIAVGVGAKLCWGIVSQSSMG